MAEVDKSVNYSAATVKVGIHTHTEEKAAVFIDKKQKLLFIKMSPVTIT
jgi:hypothetical protein